jgi:dimethylargininase
VLILTRPLPRSFAAAALSRHSRDAAPIDQSRAEAQHADYVAALREAAPDAVFVEAPAADDLPDCVFVEDIALAVPGGVMFTTPGAVSRQAEVEGVRSALLRAGLKPCGALSPADTLDGGDVLSLGGLGFLVGRSRRTTPGAARALAEASGLPAVLVPVPGDELHLKSALTWAGPTHGLLCAASVRPWFESTLAPLLPGGDSGLGGVTFLPDPLAANVVIVGETALWQGQDCASFAALRAKPGLRWRRVNMDELAKADGALTCCSVIFP